MKSVLTKIPRPKQSKSDPLKVQLAAAYRILAMLKLDDLTYAHLSARHPDGDSYFIYPFGLLFEEVTASSLLRVSLDGKVLDGKEENTYKKMGYVVHGGIDVNAIFHLQSTAGVAVSAQSCGLLPLSQFSLHFYNRISYHSYDPLSLEAEQQGTDLIKALGKNKAMILQNHGTLTCGKTIEEAFLYAYFLEQACKVQCHAVAGSQKILIPPKKVCEKAAQELRNFEQEFGHQNWTALLRKLDRLDLSYKD